MVQKILNINKTLLIIIFSLVIVLLSCEIFISNDQPDNTEKLTVVNSAIIHGITPPVAGKKPVPSVDTPQYYGSITWNPDISEGETFAEGISYTAEISLNAKSGYTMLGVAANFFKVEGVISVSNAADSGVVTAVFPRTAEHRDIVTINNIPGLTPPLAGAVPVRSIETAQYTGSVTWSPYVNETFAALPYTASIALNAKAGFSLEGITNEFFFTAEGASRVSYNAHTGILTVEFPISYSLTISALQGGTLDAQPPGGPAGTLITLTINPETGFYPSLLSVKDTGGNELQIYGGGFFRTFRMPSSAVNVSAVFTELPANTASIIFTGFENEIIDLTLSTQNNLSRSSDDILRVSVSDDYDHYQWYLNADVTPVAAGISEFIIISRNFNVGSYTLTALVWKNGIPYSKKITFAVVN